MLSLVLCSKVQRQIFIEALELYYIDVMNRIQRQGHSCELYDLSSTIYSMSRTLQGKKKKKGLSFSSEVDIMCYPIYLNNKDTVFEEIAERLLNEHLLQFEDRLCTYK